MNVPPLLRNISCEHRDAVTRVLGEVRPEPGWTPPPFATVSKGLR